MLKLFNHVPADIAIFGEKDFQQLLVIKQMVADLDVPITIASPTIRDVDGLALSSRNGYLSAEQRAIAPTLYASLQQVRHDIMSGTPIEQVIAAGKQQILDGGFDSLDYLGYCNSADLQPLSHYSEQSVPLVAARLGTTRLIDNLPVASYFIPAICCARSSILFENPHSLSYQLKIRLCRHPSLLSDQDAELTKQGDG